MPPLAQAAFVSEWLASRGATGAGADATGVSFLDLSSFDRDDASERLAEAVRSGLPSWRAALRRAPSSGAPAVLILSLSARRCVSLLPHLAVFGCRVGKLFAKHVKDRRGGGVAGPRIAVGTPQRVHALVEAGKLPLAGLKLLFVDASWRDVKGFSVFEQRDAAEDLRCLLSAGGLRTELDAGRTTVGLW